MQIYLTKYLEVIFNSFTLGSTVTYESQISRTFRPGYQRIFSFPMITSYSLHWSFCIQHRLLVSRLLGRVQKLLIDTVSHSVLRPYWKYAKKTLRNRLAFRAEHSIFMTEFVLNVILKWAFVESCDRSRAFNFWLLFWKKHLTRRGKSTSGKSFFFFQEKPSPNFASFQFQFSFWLS